MAIVLNEHEWAKEMILARSLGKKPFETISRVARYYLDKQYSKREVRKLLDTFLLQCDPSASLPKWSDLVDYALERAMKYTAIQIDYIDVTAPELDRIDALSGKQAKRLAFTLLCLAKYWDLVNPNGDHWVNSKDAEIMRMANINTSIRRQSILYHQLHEAGLIQFSKKVDNTNVRVCFIQPGESAIHISDFRNLGYQYLRHRGEAFFECQNCGITAKLEHPQKGMKQRYCKECAVEVALRQRVNSVMRQRTRVQCDSQHVEKTEVASSPVAQVMSG